MTIVLKRDGTKENFDLMKIERIARSAGLSKVDAQKISKNVFHQINKNKEVTSLEIRGRVLLELEQVDKYAAGLFAWYEKNKT